MTTQLVVLLEEPSAKHLLEGVLRRLLPDDWYVQYVVFQGKQDLEKKMTRRMRAWRTPGARFLVLRDQDSGDCHVVKAGLKKRCEEAGRPDALVRIACRELEAWILGDLAAFSDEFDKPAAAREQNRAKYSNPDAVGSAVTELRSFEPLYQKVDGARRMGPRLDPATNGSPSFRTFCRGVERLVQEATE